MIKPGIVFLDEKEYQSAELRAATEFYVDSNLHKHVERIDDSWRPVQCSFDDELIKDDSGVIRVSTDVDQALKEAKRWQQETTRAIDGFIATETALLVGTDDKERQKRFKENQASALAIVNGTARQVHFDMLDIQLQRQKARNKAPYAAMNLDQFAAAIVKMGDAATMASGLIEDVYMHAMDKLEAIKTEDDKEALLSELKVMAEAAKQQVAATLQ